MSDYNFSYDDLDSMISDAAQGFDFSGVNGLDLSGVDVSNINGLDLPGEFNIDPNAFSLDDIDSMLADAAGGTGGFSLSDVLGDSGEVDLSAPLLTPEGIDESFTGNLGENEFNRYLETLDSDYKSPLADLPAQEMQITPENQASFDKNLTDIVDNRGGFTSQWQQAGSDRIMINDDGTGIGINENGDSYDLSTKEVGEMIRTGQLNTSASGYNTATGGNKVAPGGGSQVVLKDGKTGTLTTGGKVINNDTGKVIGTEKDVKTVVTQDGDGNTITKTPEKVTTGTGIKTGTGTKTGTQSQSGLGALLPLLLAMLAMNKGGGGGGGKSSLIPGLTATQKQTPYAQQQRAPGYRPGQGGISYFEPTQYTPKMAAGGGISRLLQGPGDGVSDSIPAVIDGGMAGGGQPARVARGEYILDARTVAAVGNGSTDAGAERLDKMRENILRDDRKAGVGKDSKAYRHLMA
jgi:hypothetical protein